MALPNTEILVGAAPLLWSNVYEAFEKINENFTSLDLATGGTAVNLESLYTSVSAAANNTYSLGSESLKWKKLYVSEYAATDSDMANGLWAGTAQIKGISGTVDLPANSTVDGLLLIDPDKTFFKTVNVNNGLSIVAADFGSEIKLLSGDGINLAANVGDNSIEFSNTGILEITDGSGISHSTVNGVATVINAGVRSLQSVATLPTGRTLGAGININSSTGDNIRITNTGVISINPGFGITVSTDNATGIVTITNGAPVVPSFAQIQVNGDTNNKIQADGVSDILNITSGEGITLTKNTSTDTLTITVNPVFDLKGSVFGDDSTKIVDAVENKIYSTFFGNLTGNVTGNSSTATTAGNATTVTLVATDSTAATHYVTFVDTATGNENVRTDTSLTYNPSTNILTAGTFNGNVTGTVTGNIFTNLIDSADSSAIAVTPKVIFSSDVDVENELRVRGSLMISVTQLKSIAATSSDFAAFKTAIAALVA